MTRRKREAISKILTLQYFVNVIAISFIYLVSAKLGLSLAESTKQVTAIWPPTGIALVVLILFRRRYWPAILLGAFLANISTHESFAVASAIAVGNTLEALTGAFLLRHFIDFKGRLDTIKEVLGLVVLAAIFSTTVSATIGTISLAVSHLTTWHQFWPVWALWWIGDTMGALILGSFLFVIAKRKSWQPLFEKPMEAIFLLIFLFTIMLFIFSAVPGETLGEFSLAYLAFPFIIWAALRFTQLGAVSTTLIITTTAIIGTLHNLGPFARGDSVEQNLVFLNIYMGVVALTAMLLGAVVAERIKSEQELVAHAKILAESRTQVLHNMARRREAEKQKDQLVSMASHELKTPLTSAKVFIEILQRHLRRKPGNNLATEYTTKVSEELNRLAKLTVDLIDMSKAKAGKLQLRKEKVNINRLVEEVVADTQLTTSVHKLTIKGLIKRPIQVDSERIRQVLVNLLTNAIKHSPKGSKIIVSLAANRKYLTIKIQDFGEGIAKKEQNKVFEPFYQVTDPSKFQGGLGLGLHIARQLVELHHGEIWVESQLKKGSVFAFSIPF